MDYTLQLKIDDEDLVILKGAQQNIIIAKPVGGGSPNVSWLTIDPFPDNMIKWTEAYGIYASNSSIQAGAQIHKLANVAVAHDANTYPFRASNTFGPASSVPPVPNGTFAISNQNDNQLYPFITFGLTQSATIGPTTVKNAPISAATVPMNQSVTLTPLTSAWVWLESNLLSGTVITQVTSKQAIATFGDGVDTITLKYSRAKGCFVPSTQAGVFTKSKNVMLYNPLAPEVQGATEDLRELVSFN